MKLQLQLCKRLGRYRSAFVVLGESMALAEAARAQLEAAGTVSRRPATLCCFSVFEEIAHVVEEAGVEGFQLDDCVRGKEGGPCCSEVC